MALSDSPESLAPDEGALLATAESKAAFLLRLRSGGIRDLALLRALELVPRETFVPKSFAELAGRDLALPLACGQTMMAPSLLARMIDTLDLSPRHRVLEIGTGSGYAAAVLSHIVREVVSFERFRILAEAARGRLTRLSRDNVLVFSGDGFALPPESGAFDRIIIHAACSDIPTVLVDRLAEDGLLLFPRETEGHGQGLWRLSRKPMEIVPVDECGPCFFQPLLSGMAQFL